MVSNRREYYKKNKKRIRRELKNTLNGVLSACFGLTAAVLLCTAVGVSFDQAGEGGAALAALGLIGLVLGIGGLFFGITALKEPNIRPALPRIGSIVGGLAVVVFVVLYILGAVAA